MNEITIEEFDKEVLVLSYNVWKYGNCRGKIERIRLTVKESF